MMYKPGDKVKIKTWGQMKKEFGSNHDRFQTVLNTFPSFSEYMEKSIPKNRVIEIGDIHSSRSYKIRNSRWLCSDDMIEKLEEGFFPIESRFEILDL